MVAPKVGGAKDNAGKMVESDVALYGAPSVLFDSVAILASKESAADLAANAAAVDWVRDAFGYLKVLGHSAEAQPLLDTARVNPDSGVIVLNKGADAFIKTAKEGHIWAREPGLRPPS